jgi:hypothetical protein
MVKGNLTSNFKQKKKKALKGKKRKKKDSFLNDNMCVSAIHQ